MKTSQEYTELYKECDNTRQEMLKAVGFDFYEDNISWYMAETVVFASDSKDVKEINKYAQTTALPKIIEAAKEKSINDDQIDLLQDLYKIIYKEHYNDFFSS